MPDSRVAVPIADFTRTMRSLIPRYASLPDEQLIDVFVSENPQCRLLRQGADVTLENLSSILAAEAARKVESAPPRSEPAPAAVPIPIPPVPVALSPVLPSQVTVTEPIESEKPRQDAGDSGETIAPSIAISGQQEQSDANDFEPRLSSLEPDEEKKRRVLPWVFSVLAALALGGAVLYYAQHRPVENQSSNPPAQTAPVTAASPQDTTTPTTAVQEHPPAPVADQSPQEATASPAAVPEHPPQPVTTAPSEAVKTEPTIALPALTVDQLFQRLHAHNGGGDLIDKRVRIRGKIEKLDENEVSFVGQDGSLTYWFDVRGLGENDLHSLKAGDVVEVLCAYTGNRASTGDTVMRWSFHGFKIRKA